MIPNYHWYIWFQVSSDISTYFALHSFKTCTPKCLWFQVVVTSTRHTFTGHSFKTLTHQHRVPKCWRHHIFFFSFQHCHQIFFFSFQHFQDHISVEHAEKPSHTKKTPQTSFYWCHMKIIPWDHAHFWSVNSALDSTIAIFSSYSLLSLHQTLLLPSHILQFSPHKVITTITDRCWNSITYSNLHKTNVSISWRDTLPFVCRNTACLFAWSTLMKAISGRLLGLACFSLCVFFFVFLSLITFSYCLFPLLSSTLFPFLLFSFLDGGDVDKGVCIKWMAILKDVRSIFHILCAGSQQSP